MHDSVKFFVFVVIFFLGTIEGNAEKLVSKINMDGTYSFAAGGNTKFYIESGDASLQADKMFYTTANQSLKLVGHKAVTGSDVTGTYEGTVFEYMAGTTKMQNQVLVYNGGEFIRFSQSFPDGVFHSNVSSNDDTLSSFPSFLIGNQTGTSMLGYINLFDNMCGHGYSIANISHAADYIPGGQRAGPFVLFDSKDNVMILSSFSNFMAHSMTYGVKKNQMQFGIMGGVTSVPVDYQIDTILYYSSDGINRGIEGWGEVLTRRYGKTRTNRDNDFTIKYLGYWTDNGAYYYYQTETNKSYEQTILDIVNFGIGEGIPYRYVQYDSWWYYKGVGDGVKNWTAMPSIFPNGSEYLFHEHKLPVAAHNRYWASDTTYAKKNGGNYNFYVEESKAIPYDDIFWQDLMKNGSLWGLIMYEQDWLDREFELMTVTHTDINLGRIWLMEMGQAAEGHDMTIQYCMALSRHMLQSVEIPAVTQARVSGDYQPGNDQWKIGITSMFANAIHLAPFKDTFWTSKHQEGSQYPKDEPYPELQSAMATLSTGPVGPSDKIGSTDYGTLYKCCRNDGMILKPSRPITTTDERISSFALPMLVKDGPNNEAEVHSTFTDLWYSSKMMRHGIVLTTDLKSTDYSVYPKSLYLDVMVNTTHVAYHGYPTQDLPIFTFSEAKPLHIPPCGRSDFQLWYTSPVIVMSNGTRVAILGERNKWVPVSRQRIKDVEHKGDNLLVRIEGGRAEVVQFGFMVDSGVRFINCNFGNAGTATIHLQSNKCILEQ